MTRRATGADSREGKKAGGRVGGLIVELAGRRLDGLMRGSACVLTAVREKWWADGEADCCAVEREAIERLMVEPASGGLGERVAGGRATRRAGSRTGARMGGRASGQAGTYAVGLANG